MADFQELEKLINNLSGIRKMVIVARDGTPLNHASERNSYLANYVAYIAITAEQLRPHLGFNGPYQMVMEQVSGNKILAVLGTQMILGLELDAHVSPAIILEKINPVFEQIAI
jgi:predicted regulator of Ras-like GTPase activity (Roadblock/LC7/MglB family)